MSRKYFIYASIIYSILLLLASTISGGRISKIDLTFFDKFLHFSAYCIFGFLLVNSFKNVNILILIFIVIIGTIYGGFNEIWQMYVADRYASVYDGIANGVGMVIGTVISYKYLLFSHD